MARLLLAIATQLLLAMCGKTVIGSRKSSLTEGDSGACFKTIETMILTKHAVRDFIWIPCDPLGNFMNVLQFWVSG